MRHTAAEQRRSGGDGGYAIALYGEVQAGI